MLLHEKEVLVGPLGDGKGVLAHLAEQIERQLSPDETPIRFVVTKSNEDGYHCELGVMSEMNTSGCRRPGSVFDFRRRRYENAESFNAVFCIPTGVGAEVGGHSGDGGAAARLLAGACDRLITHPNVVNAADINELPANALYVEGSVVTRLMMGTAALQPVRSNRVMVVIDDHEDPFIREASINSVSAARVALGMDCPMIVSMRDKVLMRALYAPSGRAVGRIDHLDALCEVLCDRRGEYDAVAISSMIQVPDEYHSAYFEPEMGSMVNPWGGVEAMLTHAVSMLFDVPSAHSPMVCSREILELDVGAVDPRKAAEAVSTTYLHCILKGLHASPRIVNDPPELGAPGLLSAADVSCLVIPDGCLGLPTLAAIEQGIPVIAVRDAGTCMRNNLESLPFAAGKLFTVDNYLEAAGVMTALRAGVSVESVRRPIEISKIETVSSTSLDAAVADAADAVGILE